MQEIMVSDKGEGVEQSLDPPTPLWVQGGGYAPTTPPCSNTPMNYFWPLA